MLKSTGVMYWNGKKNGLEISRQLKKRTQWVNWYSNADLTAKKARFTEAKMSFQRNFRSTFFEDFNLQVVLLI